MNVDQTVLDRYSKGAEHVEASLCCPVNYDDSLLKMLPQEIIDKDYGCGDPSRYVRHGDRVLDLGSGSGKICYMAAQLVGDRGHVIGVDMNDDMLALARKYQAAMAEKLGSDRVTFLKGRIQDLALDVQATDAFLAEHPVTRAADMQTLHGFQTRQKHQAPLITDASIDLVISNCVLNLVSDTEKRRMVEDIFRVLKPGGRIAISDIISDEPVPENMKADPELWSGCISGAFQETEFLQVFKDAGFAALAYDKWEAAPWQTVEHIEFRSVTLTAVKPDSRDPMDHGHAVIYRGPYTHVVDEQGRVYFRGERMAVSDVQFQRLSQDPYAGDFITIEPPAGIVPTAWCAGAAPRRPASETKSGKQQSKDSGGCCG